VRGLACGSNPRQKATRFVFTMRNLSRQMMNQISMTSIKNVWETRLVWRYARDDRAEFLIKTRSIEYRKIKQQRHINLQEQKSTIYLTTWVIFPKGCAVYLEVELQWKTSLVVLSPYTVRVRLSGRLLAIRWYTCTSRQGRRTEYHKISLAIPTYSVV